VNSRETFLREKYLRRHPAPEIPRLAQFTRVVVIPAWNELTALPATLDALQQAGKPSPVATLVVVNFPPDGDAAESLATIEYLQARQAADESLFYLYLPALESGVGAARKSGMDAFLRAKNHTALADDWIFSLDADTRVSADYFCRSEEAFQLHPEVSAWTFPYHHTVENLPDEPAVRRYEAYLARYVEKLAAARSPYAISTVGSAFCVNLAAYLKAGGMKVRQAGEDFYFLCELVKTGRVQMLDGKATVYPSGRVSGRTPFGTGKAIENLLAGKELNEICDAAFDELAAVLKLSADPALRAAPQSWMAKLPCSARQFLEAEKFPATWQKVLQNTPDDEKSVQRAFHLWFDGLKTLRYLHFAKSMRGSAAI